MPRFIDFLRSADIPFLARSNYRIEFRHYLLWSTLVAAIEGNIAGIVVKKTFHAEPWLVSIVWAIPIFVNTLNLVWGVLLRGRPRRPTMMVLAACAAGVALTVAFTPSEWEFWGGVIFAAQLFGTHIFLSGLITVRAAVWKANYATADRARITSRLQMLRFLVVMAAGASIGLIFDWRPEAYRYVYPTVTVLGLLSLLPLRRLRVRGEKRELRRLHVHLAEKGLATASPRAHLWSGLLESATILRRDKRFAGYMTGQFLLGSANFFTEPILLNILIERLEFGYFHSTLVMLHIPIVFLLLSLPIWAPYFDRVGVVHFRILNSACWIGGYACATIFILLLGSGDNQWLWLAFPILLIGRVFAGLARGGGALAWTLGHLHFAPDHQKELYQGIHIVLTGVRGLTMPFLGWFVYSALGWGSFAIALASAITAHFLFRRLAAAERPAARDAEAHAAELRASAARSDVT